ncbi:MAG: hypothetical protein IJJ15_08955 [Ruminococcus sp.]|nr:hypothetical protein [Ruminococcus sp.]
MPYINARLTSAVSKEDEIILKAKLGEAITLLGKGEAYLMVEICDNCRLYFGGKNDADIAYFEVKLLGKARREQYESLTAKICEIVSEMFGISGDKVYVKFEEVENWGFNGFLF